MATLTPEQELAKIQSENYAGGEHYGRTPNGIVDLRTGAMVGGSSQYGGNSLAQRYGVPSPTPGATAPSSTPAPSLPGTAAKSPLDLAQEEYFNSLNTKVDPAAIRESVRKRMQAQIDSTNVLYEGLIADQGAQNQKQYDRVRAINVGAGLGGSDFATAGAMDAEGAGNSAIEAIKREQATKVAVILGNIDQRAQDEVQAATATAKQNLTEKVNYLQGKQDSARTDLKTLAGAGVALEQLSTDQYANLLKQSGYDDFTFKTVYNASRPPKAKIDYQWKTAGNKIFGYGIDPLTGKVSTVETEIPGGIPKEYKPQVLDNGTIVFYPDQIDPTKPFKDQIFTYGTPDDNNPKNLKEVRGGLYNVKTGKWVVAPSQSSAGADNSRVGAAGPAMEALRDPNSGYVASKAYQDMYTTYTKTNPGKGKEFLDNYPVEIYIDPKERYIFSKSGQ